MGRYLSSQEKGSLFAAAYRKIAAATEALTEGEARIFSDIDETERLAFQKAWRGMNDASRCYLFRELRGAFERDDLLDYTPLICAGLDDPEVEVRLGALALIPAEVEKKFVAPLIELLQDREELVRLGAVRSLQRYIGERVFRTRPQRRVESAIAALERCQPGAEGAFADALMEALATADSPLSEAMISRAIHSSNPASVAAALRAVRTTLDDRWAENVLTLLEERDPLILIEAIRAAAALRLEKAREPLLKMTLEFESFGAAIFSELILALATIGGELPAKVIGFLDEELAEDSDLEEVMVEALELLELGAFERSIRRDGEAADESTRSDDWASDEDYLDQLAIRVDSYLERNGLLDAVSETAEPDAARGHAHGEDDGGCDDEHELDGEDLSKFRIITADELNPGKKRTIADWSAEEVAAFREANAGKEIDWDALLREEDDF